MIASPAASHEQVPSGLGSDAFDTSNVDRLFTLLCERRGWTKEYLALVNDSTHEPLKDIDVMIGVLEKARVDGKKIVIAPDFDLDGISSGVLGYAGLCELGFNVDWHLPDYSRGHDLSPMDIDEIHKNHPDTSVLLTCDGGVNSHAGISAARSLGWITLVTDHHQELEPGCNADVTVNPCRIDETYANRGICGAHVLYQVLEAYTRTYQPHKMGDIRLLRLFAGLGTVSDVMPILFENRDMVRDSLSIARLAWAPPPLVGHWRKPDTENIDTRKSTLLQLLRAEPHHPMFVSAFEGFTVMLKAFAQTGKVTSTDSIDEGFYGFYMAPVMNSPRRTQAPLVDTFAVFLHPSEEEKLAAAHRLLENNELRKKMTIFYYEQIESVDQPLAPWVFFSEAPKGMLGLLANKLMEDRGHPVIVMNMPTGVDAPVSGSARAPGWFDVIEAVSSVPGLHAIGHRQACGVSVPRSTDLQVLADLMFQRTQLAIAVLEESGDVVTTPADLVLGSGEDCDADLIDLETLFELLRRVDGLRPFGHDFTEPRYQIVVDPGRFRVERIGSEKTHLRLVTRDGLICLWWNAAEAEFDRLEALVALRQAEIEGAAEAGQSVPETVPLRFNAKLQVNTFAGNTRIQAIITEAVVPEVAEIAAAAS